VVNYGTIIGGAGGDGGGAGGTGIRYGGGTKGIVNHGNVLSSGTGIHVYGHTTGGIVINGAVIAGLGEGEEMLRNLCKLGKFSSIGLTDRRSSSRDWSRLYHGLSRTRLTFIVTQVLSD
jgi:hypothetical protein